MFISSWTDPSGNLRLDFYKNNEEPTIYAEIIDIAPERERKRAYQVPESRISVETKNVHDLMRGNWQATYNLSQLNPTQKDALLKSLGSRSITVENDFNSSSIIIHALP